MTKSSRIWLQQTQSSVSVSPVTPSSDIIRFAQIQANFVHKVIPGQVYETLVR